MSDPGGRIGGSFAERLTQLYETVREAGSQETLDTVRRLGQELGSDGVDSFIGAFGSIADEDRNFLKNLFAGRVADADAAAAGAKSLFTRELEGQLRQRRLEVHFMDDVGRPHEGAGLSPTDVGSPHLDSRAERLGINPQPEPPGDFVPLERRAAGAADKLATSAKAAQQFVSEMEKRGFNPQPEPPGKEARQEGAAAGAAHKLAVEAEKRALGPQPEPPDSFSPAELASSGRAARKFVSEMEKSAFNPQPEPPGDLIPQAKAAGEKSAHKFVPEVDKRAFNPQPEPPGTHLPEEKTALEKSKKKMVSELEKRGFNPQPEPPADFIPVDKKKPG